MDEIFVDSNVFIALSNEKDTLHHQSLRVATKLEEANVPLVISNLIFSEVVTILSQRVTKTVSIRAGKKILESPTVKMIFIDEYLHSPSWQIFQEISRKDMSFVDCSILAVMRAEGIQKLLTFDREDFSPLKKQFVFELF